MASGRSPPPANSNDKPSGKSEQQAEAEHAATVGWLLGPAAAKGERQTAALFGAGEPTEVHGRPPIRLGLPPEPERERNDDDPFDSHTR
jgi:hypothetical protein